MFLKTVFLTLIILILNVKSQSDCIASTVDLSSESVNGILTYILRWFSGSTAVNISITRVPTLIFRVTTMHSAAWFDSIAPYHDTQIGAIVNDIPKRPIGERIALNRHIAMLYSTHKIWSNFFPSYKTLYWDRMLSCKGYDPTDLSEDLTTPIGIGNYIGRKQLEWWHNDGMNELGYDSKDNIDLNYNPQPYKDVLTGYVPQNTAYELKKPANWQPNIVYNNFGSYTIQNFIGPQWSKLKGITGVDPDDYSTPIPSKSKNYNSNDYILQVMEVLNASANLSDVHKMTAEWFEQKIPSLGNTITWESNARGFNSIQYSHYHFSLHAAAFDSGVVAWSKKIKYDAVRPFSAIRYLFSNKSLRAWGGPYKGTVNNIKGKEWRSYLPTGDHPDYPSGSSCFCHAHAQISRRYFNTEYFITPYVTTNIAAGSSFIEPGTVPATTITLGPFSKFSDWAWACGLSRLWGGVHFMDAIIQGKYLCEAVADDVYEYVQSLIDGTAEESSDDNDSSSSNDSNDNSDSSSSSSSSSSNEISDDNSSEE